MQTPYSGPELSWSHPLFTRRVVGANCDLAFDFEWEEIIGHNHGRFPGLQDLSQAISDHAKSYGKTPMLLLSDKVEVAFEEKIRDSIYVAIVNIKSFLASVKKHPDRSAVFFLSAISNISTNSNGAATPFRVQQLLKALEAGLDGRSNVLIEALEKGGSKLTLSLLDAAVKGLDKSVSPQDLEALTNIFSTSTSSVISDAATAAKRRAAVEEFEQLLTEAANEQKFQRWFQRNAWVLGSDCVRILEERQIDVQNIADFLVEGYDGRADVIELKRPDISFWRSEKDHDNYIPHTKLIEAIIQAQNYQFELEGEINNRKTFRRLGEIPIAKPYSLLIHGRSHKWNDEHFEAQRLLNAGFTNLNVITYDQVLRRAQILLGHSV